jgi:hypothetical protein
MLSSIPAEGAAVVETSRLLWIYVSLRIKMDSELGRGMRR